MTRREGGVPAEDDSGQPEATALEGAALNLMFARSALRRKRWLWIASGILGLVFAVGINIYRPMKYASVVTVKMAPSSLADPPVAIVDDVALINTQNEAKTAIAYGNLKISAAALTSHYKGSSVGDSLIQIKTTAPTETLAIKWANSLGHAFLTVQNVQATSLLSTEKQDQADMQNLSDQIAADEKRVAALTGDPTAAAEILNLNDEKTAALSEYYSIQLSLFQTESSYKTMTTQSIVLGPAQPAALKSRKKVMITDSIAGLIAGLGLGVGIVVVGAVLTDRLRRRDEIAIAIGAPVELSVGRFRCPRFFRKWRLRRRMHNPTGDMEMIERRIRAHLEAAPASALAVISIECAAMASVVMAALALSLGQEGKNVVVTDLADGRPVQALLDRQRSPRHLERRRLPRGEGRRLSRRERRQLNRAPYPGYPELTSRSRLQSTRPSRPIITPDAMRAPLGSWEGWNLGPERPSQGNYWGSVHVNNPHSRAKWSTWQQVPLPQQEEVPVAEPSPDLPVPVQPGSVTVVSGPDDPIQTSVHRSNENVDSVLAFATLDPAFGAAHIASWATEAVVVVGAGKARADQVVAAGQMLRHAGIRARAAFVVGAESDDRSYGLPLQTDHLGR